MNSERSSFGLALVGRALAGGIASRTISKATSGPSASSASSALGCSSPNQPAIVLRPELQRRRAARMQERRAAGDDLHRVRRDAERGEQRQRVALRVIGVDRAAAGPVAAFAARLGEAAPDRRRGDALVVLAGAEEDLPDLEQRDVGEAAPRIALGRGDEAGNEARPHVGEIGGDRIGERELGLAAAEQFGRRLGDERPRHRFAQAQRGQRALGRAGCASAAASAPAPARLRSSAAAAPAARGRGRRCARSARRCRPCPRCRAASSARSPCRPRARSRAARGSPRLRFAGCRFRAAA